MIGYISIGSYRIKGDDWQSHPLREVVSTVPLYEFRPITPIHHIMGSVKSAPSNPYFVIPDAMIVKNKKKEGSIFNFNSF